DDARSGEDARARDVDGRRTRRTWGVRRDDGDARPTQRLCEGRAGDVARVPVADRLAAGDEADVLPRESCVVQRAARRGDAVVHERLPPLAPGVHADAEDGYTGVHFHTTCSFPSSSVKSRSIAISTSSPILSLDA